MPTTDPEQMTQLAIGPFPLVLDRQGTSAQMPMRSLAWPNDRASANPGIATHYEPNICSGLKLGEAFPASGGQWKQMASARIKLDPHTIDAMARRVVELLEQRGLRRHELVDAAELARRFGIERSWVYTHAIELGAVKLGNGAKPRLRFDPEPLACCARLAGNWWLTHPPARVSERVSHHVAEGARFSCFQFERQGRTTLPRRLE